MPLVGFELKKVKSITLGLGNEFMKLYSIKRRMRNSR